MVDYPTQVSQVITDAVTKITTEMREKGIPDDWRIEVTFPDATPEDMANNRIRIVAIPRPPYNRFTGEGL